jgi:hypothetical protein
MDLDSWTDCSVDNCAGPENEKPAGLELGYEREPGLETDLLYTVISHFLPV